MRQDDVDLIPPHYRSLVQPVVQFRDEDTRQLLLEGVTAYRDANDSTARTSDRLIEQFDTPALGQGREKSVERVKSTRDHCRRIVEAMDRVIAELQALD